ncbi:MAG: DNA recombination protein RmuC, partial [Gaiellaceae bacterium]
IAISLLLAAVAVAAALVWLARFLRAERGALRADSSAQLTSLKAESNAQLAERSAQIDRRLGGVTETMDRRLSELDGKVDRRLASAAQTTSQIHEGLGKANEATAQMLERAKDLARLEQALRPPKARGGFGELLLGNLLADRLPPHAYDLQHTFASGERVDAVIKVDRLVPVDAKFPLDNFHRFCEAANDGERQLSEKAFSRDLKGHVDAIAQKYIRPAEGTYDFALMYLPSEGVYYELVCGRTGAMLTYAHEKRVFPVSPTTLTAQLQVIALGLKGLQIEQHAHEVMAYCAALQKDFARFKDDFEVVGKHLGHARSKYSDAERRLDRFDGRLQQAIDHEPIETIEAETIELALPRAADAA